MSTTFQRVNGYQVVDDGDGLYFLTDGEGKIRGTFFRREPWERWWTGRDVYGAARELYADQTVDDQVAHIAERLTRHA